MRGRNSEIQQIRSRKSKQIKYFLRPSVIQVTEAVKQKGFHQQLVGCPKRTPAKTRLAFCMDLEILVQLSLVAREACCAPDLPSRYQADQQLAQKSGLATDLGRGHSEVGASRREGVTWRTADGSEKTGAPPHRSMGESPRQCQPTAACSNHKTDAQPYPNMAESPKTLSARVQLQGPETWRATSP